MPPRTKIDKSSILDVALDIVRRSGIESINSRSIANELGCSTQPIFSNYETMEELKSDIIEKATEIFSQYCRDYISSGKYPQYKSVGMAYISFASDETELFKILFMRDRSHESSISNITFHGEVLTALSNDLGLDEEQVNRFHLEMWICVHGIATMIATKYLTLSEDMISEILTDMFNGQKSVFIKEKI